MLNRCCKVDGYVMEFTIYLANAHLASSECRRVKPYSSWVRSKAARWVQDPLLGVTPAFFFLPGELGAFTGKRGCVSRVVLRIKAKKWQFWQGRGVRMCVRKRGR